MENYREKRLERQLKSQQSTSIVIGVILLLSILGNVFLFVRNSSLSNEKEEVIKETQIISIEKIAVEEANEELLADLQEMNEQIDETREILTSLRAEVISKDAVIRNLRTQVAENEQLRKQAEELELLKTEHARLEDERNKMLGELQEMSDKLEKLNNIYTELKSKTEESAYLRAYNICIHNLRDRWLGRPVEMEVARRVNRTMVSFEINGNIFVESGPLNVYLLMSDPEGNILNPSTETFTIADSGSNSSYTEYASVQYDQQPVSLDFEILHMDKLDSGMYNVEVFINGKIVGSSGYSLE